MRKLLQRSLLQAILLLATFHVAFAQNVINGRVTDATTGDPLIGASVIVKTDRQGVVTDANGNFSLSTKKDFPLTLHLDFIGYRGLDVDVYDNAEAIEIQLQENYRFTDEVVVIGYGSQKRQNVTGSIGSLKLDQEIASRPAVEVGQALYGKVAGVQVIAGSGEPGASSTIQVRGANSVSSGTTPLVVVDGIAIPNYDLNLINFNDVESIDILKDAASSAIYGSRAANGVILIQTKKGKAGKSKLNIDIQTGIQKVITKIGVMNAAEYSQASIDAAQNGWIDSGGDPLAPNTLEARGNNLYTWPLQLENPSSLPDTDFQDAIYRTAPITKLNASLTTGNERSTTYLSAGLVTQEGIAISSNYNKFSLHIQNDTKVFKWLDLGGSASISYDKTKTPFSRMYEWAVQYPQIYPVWSSNGYLGAPNNEEGFSAWNGILFRPQNGHPLYRINDDIRSNKISSLGVVYANVHLLPGLTYKSAFNFYINNSEKKNYQSVDHDLGAAYYTQGVMTVTENRTINYTAQNTLNYDKTIKDHHLAILLGTEFNKIDRYSASGERRGYDSDLIHALSAGKSVYNATDAISKTSLISYFGRVNYDYKDRYSLSASIRRDGSSRFAPSHKWGYFPAVSAGWLVSDETLFKENLKFISYFKLRASYGLTGNDSFADYKWIGTLSQGRVAIGDNLLISYYPSSITNEDLQWERTKQLNLGADLSFFDDRISLGIDVYKSVSDGLLLDVPTPIASGFSSVFRNIGKLQNKGLELSINTVNVKGQLQWKSAVTLSLNRNKILALGEDDAPMIISTSGAAAFPKINQIGSPAFSFYGYKYIGVYKNQAEIDADPSHYSSATPGDGRYEDVNHDGVLNSDDRTILGDANPDFIWGFTNTLRYKGFDLSVLFQGVQGGTMLDMNLSRSLFYHEGRNYLSEVNGRWRSEEEPGDGYHAKLTTLLDGYEHTPSSYWLRSMTYVRLKSLNIGYTFQEKTLEKLHLSSLRIYLSGTNLWTWKKAPVYDPENFTGDIDNIVQRGVSMDPYPSAKTYSIGVNIGI